MERWRGKFALVTGSSAGIGFAITEGLVRARINVFACARNVASLEELTASLPSNSGTIYPLKVDLSKEEQIKSIFQTIQTRCGHVDILVNNVVNCLSGGLDGQASDDWRLMLEEDNVQTGHIININSAEWDPSYVGLNFCGATKEMTSALTKALRYELLQKKSKIRVTSIRPGLVASRSVQELLKDDQLTGHEDSPALNCQDVADGVLYVLSVPEKVVITELSFEAH
ncbi:putative Dehydrogenase/reductase SDR family member 11 [Hypsibius exemplaris]|uniref:Dehydrogenase/reductase SDR family member 11 n=1 Tax=Hypsibius exemplaris TaxID=2072580 RepID=A0A1W0WUC6_HYPEX|nr:putative Dehydrogenase/reductase SDR family member 11 [Hypsibius exemplaris]